MSIKDLFKEKTIITEIKTTTIITEESTGTDKKEQKPFEKVAPEKIGVLDMVIAFDTTGSMAAYIDAVRKEVAELIPRLFKDNEDLRLGIVAFGDYCDMHNAQDFGDEIGRAHV